MNGNKTFFSDILADIILAARSASPQKIKRSIVRQGIKVICGVADAVDPSVATEIAVLPAAARLMFLHMLNLAGVRCFVARSGLGYDFVCHIGDLSDFPFYHRRAYAAELALCTAWLRHAKNPIIYDIGANTGFISGHLAQMLAPMAPRIYAFEPVPATYAKLTSTIRRLRLADRVFAIEAAVLDKPGSIRVSYSDRNSLHAQVTRGDLNRRVGDKLAEATAISLDSYVAGGDIVPDLIKIDAEGSEAAILSGGATLLSRRDRPALLFEFNSITLHECGSSPGELARLLAGYALYYVDDLRGQKLPFATPIPELERLEWICNIFAVPRETDAAARWQELLAKSVGAS